MNRPRLKPSTRRARLARQAAERAEAERKAAQQAADARDAERRFHDDLMDLAEAKVANQCMVLVPETGELCRRPAVAKVGFALVCEGHRRGCGEGMSEGRARARERQRERNADLTELS